MSYKMRRINRPSAGDHVPKGSLANAMSQGMQPKHSGQDFHDIAETMKQGDAYSGGGPSAHKSLGGVMQQGGSKRGR